MTIDTQEMKDMVNGIRVRALTKVNSDWSIHTINILYDLIIQEIEDYEEKEGETIALDKQ